ncbi:RR2 [Mauternbach virus]|uniref:ribonucleoside-diphosphate reductase n=1 Tax=Mauternbach virus TaxID=2486603 RepID=A0A3G3E768_9VIRU|nr:RR2 [Mauternbach virus]AYP97931.1 RR2 [Mauternbach virus]
METYSKVNNNIITDILKISQVNGVLLNDNDEDDNESNTIEDICDPKYTEYEYQNLYPPNLKFLQTYKFWGEHLSCAWSIYENDPSCDRDKFYSAPKKFQEIVLCNIACIMIGDSIVLDRIAKDINANITSIELLAMFADQTSRELVHKAMYSKMLEVSNEAAKYRSKAFRDKYMGRFTIIADKYKSSDIRIQMYFIMMCENILFAPMFQTICYLASLSYAPKLCDLNLLVMRDEYIHYKNARYQSSKFKRKIDILLARSILDEFSKATMDLCRQIIQDYTDEIYNIEHVEAHFQHVIHGFKTENDLYLTHDEFAHYDSLYNKSPAETYMTLPKYDSKINHMESNNTVYMVPGNNEIVDMSF